MAGSDAENHNDRTSDLIDYAIISYSDSIVVIRACYFTKTGWLGLACKFPD